MYLSTQYRVDSSLVRTEHAHELGIYDAHLSSFSLSRSSCLSLSRTHSGWSVPTNLDLSIARWRFLSFSLSLSFFLSSSLSLFLSLSRFPSLLHTLSRCSHCQTHWARSQIWSLRRSSWACLDIKFVSVPRFQVRERIHELGIYNAYSCFFSFSLFLSRSLSLSHTL